MAVSELVKGVLRPVIAILTSHDVDNICAKNSLTFTDLLLPFSTLNTDVAIKDPSNQTATHTVKNLSVDFRDLRRDGFLLGLTVLPYVLSEAVREAPCDENWQDSSAVLGDCPWYKTFRDSFLYWAEPGEHEFMRHYLACVLVVSTSTQDPLEQLSRLSQSQHAQQHAASGHSSPALIDTIGGPSFAATPKWFSPNIFKYHVLLHDISAGDDRKAEELYQSMKMTYGANACHLLRINGAASLETPSGASSSNEQIAPDPWRSHLQRKYIGFNRGLHIARTTALAKNSGSGIDTTAVDAMSSSRLSADPEISPFTHDTSPTTAIAVEMANGDILTAGSSENLDRDAQQSRNASPAHLRSFQTESIPHALSIPNLTEMAASVNIDCCAGERGSTEGLPSIHSSDTVHGLYLTASDRDRLRVFVQELVIRGLVPFVERQSRLLNEQVMARKGISRSFTSGVRKWFGGGGAAQSPATAANTIQDGNPTVYTAESGEMQMRRLADLCFLFHNYDLANQYYQLLRRDFVNDQAWLYYAGALEMSAICSHLLKVQLNKPYPQHYMENALTHYMNTCIRPVLSARAAIFSVEILAAMGQFSDAASQLIRMTSSENDLYSAVFLEQASRCFDRLRMRRKFAFHLVLSGHRYFKASLNSHSLRCYRMASHIYANKGWQYAENHMKYAIAQQTGNLENLKERADGTFDIVSKDSSLNEAPERPPPPSNRPKTRPQPALPEIWDGVSPLVQPMSEDKRQESAKNVVSSLSCSLSAQSRVITHDFQQYAICVIPVHLTVTNQDDSLSIQLIGRCVTEADFEPLNFHPARHCQIPLWMGRTTFLVTLEPKKSDKIQLKMVAARAGVYDASNVLIEANFLPTDDDNDYEKKSQRTKARQEQRQKTMRIPLKPIFITVSDKRLEEYCL